MDDLINIHNHAKQYEAYKEKLETDESLLAENRRFILSYLRDSELGKTIKLVRRRKLGLAGTLGLLAF